MPVIKTYEPQIRTAGGPQEFQKVSADDFGAASGRALANVGQAVGNLGEVIAKREEQQEVSDINAKMAKANADLSGKLQTIISTTQPGDNKPFEEYEKEVEDTLNKLGEGVSSFGAKSFYAENAARIKGQMFQSSTKGRAELAGIKAVQDFTTAQNNFSLAAMNDPSSLALQKELNNKGVDALVASGQLPAHKGFELKAESEKKISQAAMRGWIDLDPDYAEQKLKSGEFSSVFGPDLMKQMEGEIKQAKNAALVEQERVRREQERVLKEQQTQTQNKFLSDMTQGKLTTKQILNSNLEAFGSGSKEQFINMIKARNEGRELKDNSSVAIDVYRRIHLPDGDPNKIIDENDLNQYMGNGLSLSTIQKYREEIQGKGTAEGKAIHDMKGQLFKVAEGSLVKANSFGLKDPAGEENLLRFQADFEEAYKEGIKQGLSKREMLTPGSKNYLGNMITNYKKDSKQIMQEQAKAMRWRAPIKKEAVLGSSGKLEPSTTGQSDAPSTAKPKRNPGESAVDYMKRIKGGA